ncbi:MAG TPA: hypothetical protein VG347_18955 [Verrucomicrobiae bacterium]|nr:hypothetical protein [Verrucomicrobiae bacterium]
MRAANRSEPGCENSGPAPVDEFEGLVTWRVGVAILLAAGRHHVAGYFSCPAVFARMTAHLWMARL